MGKCSFRTDWLQKDDGKGYKVSDWCSKHSDTEFFCRVCVGTFKCDRKGFQALTQHAKSGTHLEACHFKLQPQQLHLGGVSSLPSSSSAPEEIPEHPLPTLQLYSIKDSATTAELIWILKSVVSNYSALSFDGIGDVFRAMFPGCVPHGFTLGRTKVNYVLTEALFPYFKEELYTDMEDTFYTLCYDETTNASGHKELQTTVRYWSDKQNKVVNHHLQTFFIGKATGNTLYEKVKNAIDNANLPLSKLLMLGSDGPNVNKTVHRLMNEEVFTLRNKKLVDLGFCNIHVLHNAFKKGLTKFGTDASDLIIAVHSFFDGWPSRWEDFTEIQNEVGLPNQKFLKHCSSRWLTMEGSSSRILEQWDAINKYFLKFIPIKDSKLISTANYKLITRLLKMPSIKAELLFVRSSALLFSSFTGLFQKDQPLVHLLYSVAESIVKTLIRRVCVDQKIGKGVDEIFDSKNLLPLTQMVVSDEVKVALETCEKDKLQFLNSARNHYIEACKYVITKGPISNPFIKHFRFLKPSEILKQSSAMDLSTVARVLPLNVPSDRLNDEWKLFQLEDHSKAEIDIPVDQYWSQFLNKQHVTGGGLKYPNLSKVIKCSLCLSHGNAHVERGFSVSGNILTEERSKMSERTLNAYITVKDALKLYNNKPELVPMTRKLITLAQNACKSYTSFLEERKRQEANKKKEEEERNEEKKRKAEVLKEIEDGKKSIEVKEKELKEKMKKEEQNQKVANKVFKEASNRLQNALDKKDLDEMNIANAMLAGYSKMQKEGENTRKVIKNLQEDIEKRKSTIEKRKSSIISSFCNKKQKM